MCVDIDMPGSLNIAWVTVPVKERQVNSQSHIYIVLTVLVQAKRANRPDPIAASRGKAHTQSTSPVELVLTTYSNNIGTAKSPQRKVSRLHSQLTPIQKGWCLKMEQNIFSSDILTMLCMT